MALLARSSPDEHEESEEREEHDSKFWQLEAQKWETMAKEQRAHVEDLMKDKRLLTQKLETTEGYYQTMESNYDKLEKERDKATEELRGVRILAGKAGANARVEHARLQDQLLQSEAEIEKLQSEFDRAKCQNMKSWNQYEQLRQRYKGLLEYLGTIKEELDTMHRKSATVRGAF